MRILKGGGVGKGKEGSKAKLQPANKSRYEERKGESQWQLDTIASHFVFQDQHAPNFGHVYAQGLAGNPPRGLESRSEGEARKEDESSKEQPERSRQAGEFFFAPLELALASSGKTLDPRIDSAMWQ